MDWSEAKKQIEKKIQVGTDVNSERSTPREIKETEHSCNGYNGEKGFLVKIGENENLEIPWSMLENCFCALCTQEGYNTYYFRNRYKCQYENKGCHVHVVGVIFEKAGVVYKMGNAYFINE